jgi:ribosome biogenesis protein Nip4
MGLDYCFLRLKQINGKLFLSQIICEDADTKQLEKEIETLEIYNNLIFLKVKVIENGNCTFYYSQDGTNFSSIGISFKAKEGKWIGAKLGFVSLRDGFTNDAGNIKMDWIRFKK